MNGGFGNPSGGELLIVNSLGELQFARVGGFGTQAAPAYSFAGDPDTGMYRSAANELSFSTNGSRRWIIDANGQLLTSNSGSGELRCGFGSVVNCAISFLGETGTGLYRVAANNIGVSCSGAKVLDISAAGLGITGALTLGNAAVAGAVVPTHTVTIKDSTGTTYRVPCLV